MNGGKLTDNDVAGPPVLHMSCLTTGDDDAQISRYCAYHLAIGVQRIYVFIDGPAPCPGIGGNPDIEVVNCDAAFWDRVDLIDLNDLTAKQSATRALASQIAQDRGATFYAHIDEDELLLFEDDLTQFLERIPTATRAIQLPCREAVARLSECHLRPFLATFFKVPLGRHLSRFRGLIFGAPQHLLRRGFFGHTIGKTIFRLPVRYENWSMHGPLGPIPDDFDICRKDSYLLHFDSSHFPTFEAKWERRIDGVTKVPSMAPQRKAQQDLHAEAGRHSLWKLYRKIYILAGWRIALLRLLGAVMVTRKHLDILERKI